MKAAYFDGTKLLYTDRPDSQGETLVRIDLTGICGTDLEILDGYMDYTGIPGHEFVGIITKSEQPGYCGTGTALVDEECVIGAGAIEEKPWWQFRQA